MLTGKHFGTKIATCIWLWNGIKCHLDVCSMA